MKKKVGINGFGRMGRLGFRAGFGSFVSEVAKGVSISESSMTWLVDSSMDFSLGSLSSKSELRDRLA